MTTFHAEAQSAAYARGEQQEEMPRDAHLRGVLLMRAPKVVESPRRGVIGCLAPEEGELLSVKVGLRRGVKLSLEWPSDSTEANQRTACRARLPLHKDLRR